MRTRSAGLMPGALERARDTVLTETPSRRATSSWLAPPLTRLDNSPASPAIAGPPGPRSRDGRRYHQFRERNANCELTPKFAHVALSPVSPGRGATEDRSRAPEARAGAGGRGELVRIARGW